MTVDQPAELPVAAAPSQAEIDPRTGEPRRPVIVTVATALTWLAIALIAVSLLTAYWRAVFDYAHAAWLLGLIPTEPGSLERVLLVVAATVAGLTIATALAVAGYYAWDGYRWSRGAAVIAAVLSIAALVLNPIAWPVPVLAVAAVALLWFPAASRFFTAWETIRHPEQALSAPVTEVDYGPLPRYR